MEATRRGRPLGKGRIDRARVEATTEADTRRHMIEDGLDPDDPLAGFEPTVSPATIRARLDMSQAEFAKALQVPLSTLRNWEQGRTVPDPAARTLLAWIGQDPFKVMEDFSEDAREVGTLTEDDTTFLLRMKSRPGSPTQNEAKRIRDIERKLRALRLDRVLVADDGVGNQKA